MQNHALVLLSLFALAGAGCASSEKKAGGAVAPPAASAAAAAKSASGKTKAAAASTKAATTDAARPAAAAAPAQGVLTCGGGGETRTLEIVAKDEGCELRYAKAGTPETIATARQGSDHCQAVHDRIRGKLEGAGFSCK